MNAIVQLLNTAGQAFVDFAVPMLIQSSVLVLILLAVDAVLRKRVRAVFRYWIWMLVLAKLVLPPSLWSPVSVGTWLGDKLEISTTALLEHVSRSSSPRSEGGTPSTPQGQDALATKLSPAVTNIFSQPQRIFTEPPQPEPIIVPPSRLETAQKPALIDAAPVLSLHWQGFTLLAWGAVVVALLLLLAQRTFFVQGLVAQADEASGAMLRELAECRRHLGLRRPISMRFSPNAASPAVCGLLRPVILVPQTLASRLHGADLRAVLLHELAHVKRGDLWINVIQTLLQIVYFYNPLLWLANTIIRRIREKAVDETVLVAMGEAAQQYPETLVHVAKLAFARRPALSLRLIGVVESKSALTSRIQHILNRPLPKTARLGLLGLVVIILIATVLLPMAKGQTFGDLFGRDVLIRLRHADKPGEDYRKTDATETYTKNYTVSFQKGEKLAVVAELYQVGQPMRPLGSKIFADPGHTQRLSIVVMRKYLNKDQTAIEHNVEVVLGQEALRVNGIVVNTPPSPFLSPTRGWPTKPDLVRKKRDGKPYVEFTQLLTIDAYQDDRPDRPPIGTWRPDASPYMDTLHSHACFLTIKALPLSQLSVLQVYPPLGGMQLLDGTILAADASSEQREALVEKYRQDLATELAAQSDQPSSSAQKLTEPRFKNAQEALGVLNLLRNDGQIQEAMQVIEQTRPPVDFGALDAATRDRIRAGATKWLRSPSIPVRACGVALGLRAGFGEFLEPALALLDYRDPANGQQARDAQLRVVFGLGQYKDNMPPADVARLKEFVRHCDNGYVWDLVFEHCFHTSSRPVVLDALWELAQEEPPWLWWPATKALAERQDERLAAYSALPESMKLRVILASRTGQADAALAPKVRALLRGLFTVEMVRMCRWDLHTAVTTHLDRKEATAAYLDVLSAALPASTQLRFERDFGSSNRLYEEAAWFLWDINFWHGINLGQLGTYKPEVGYPNTIRTAQAFEQAVTEAITWYQTDGHPQPLEPVFAGQVVDTSARAIPGVTATLEQYTTVFDAAGRAGPQRVEAGAATTDAEGRFVFRNPANAGSYYLTVRAKGFVPRESLAVTRWPEGRFQVAVNTQDNVIVLEKPASLSGRVIGPDGQPPVTRTTERILRPDGRLAAPGIVRVLSYLTHGAAMPSLTEIDAQGRFTVSALMSGYHLVSYEERRQPTEKHDGSEQVKAFQLVHLKEGQAVDNVTLDLREATATLEAKVVDREGQPARVESFLLQVPIPSEKAQYASVMLFSRMEPQSVYRFPNLPPLDGYLYVFATGQPPKQVALKLVAGQTTRCRVGLDTTKVGTSIRPMGTDQEKQIVLPEVDRQPVVLDLATGELVPLPPVGPEPQKLEQALTKLGKGDLLYDCDSGDRTLILVRGATSEQAQGDTDEPPWKGYLIGPHLPGVLTIKTAEGQQYQVTILAANDEACTLQYSLIPTDQGAGGGALAEPGKRDATQNEDRLRQMLAAAGPWSVVTVPPGRYTAPLEITQPITLRGESAQDCILEVTADRPALSINTQGRGQVAVQNLTIRWQWAGDKKVETPAALLVKDTNALIQNCRFAPLGDFQRSPTAVYISGHSESKVLECRFSGFDYVICYGPNTQGMVLDSTITDCGHQGVIGYDGSELVVQGNIITGSKFHAVRCTGGRMNVLHNLLIGNANRGIYLGNKTGRGMIMNNLIMGNGTGISAFGQAAYTIAANVILNNRYAGIDMRDSCQLNIHSNILMKNQRGLKLFKEGAVNRNQVQDNTFWANAVDVEGLDTPIGSLIADPHFADPNHGDFTTRAPTRGSLTDPRPILELWKKYEQWQKGQPVEPIVRGNTPAPVPRRLSAKDLDGHCTGELGVWSKPFIHYNLQHRPDDWWVAMELLREDVWVKLSTLGLTREADPRQVFERLGKGDVCIPEPDVILTLRASIITPVSVPEKKWQFEPLFARVTRMRVGEVLQQLQTYRASHPDTQLQRLHVRPDETYALLRPDGLLAAVEITGPASSLNFTFVPLGLVDVTPAEQGLSGRVVDPNGKPITGAQVARCTKDKGVDIQAGQLLPTRWGGKGGEIVKTDAQGRFSFPPGPDEFDLIAAHDTGFAWITNKELAASSDLRLEPWGRIDGTLKIGRALGAGEQVGLFRGGNRSAPDQNIHFDDETYEETPRGLRRAQSSRVTTNES